MLRGILGVFAMLFAMSGNAKINVELNLECFVSYDNFDGIEYETIKKQVQLTAMKQYEGGSVLVTQSDGYEFWAMIYSLFQQDKKNYVTSFQLAIRHKLTGLFFHGESSSKGLQPDFARVSLIDYYQDTFDQKGELSFRCHNTAAPEK